MTDWVPVLIVAVVVVCAAAYLLLDPKLRPPKKAARAGPFQASHVSRPARMKGQWTWQSRNRRRIPSRRDHRASHRDRNRAPYRA
jgi:hypothetical protein